MINSFRHLLKFVILIPLVIGLRSGFSQNPETVSEAVDSIAKRGMESYNIPGLAIGVVSKDKVLVSKGYGLRNIEVGNNVDENTTFHTASVSKLFTAQAVVQLFYRQNRSLNSRLSEILPQLNFSSDLAKTITVKQLLNHSSGLPDIRNYQWHNHYTSDKRLEEYFEAMRLEVDSGPGTEYAYSNLGYNILAYVVQVLSNQLFEDYMQEYILQPAGMAQSDFRYFNTTEDNRASPHSLKKLGKKVYVRKVYPYSREHAGSSTLNASVEDLNRWMIRFLKELRSGQYEEMLEPSIGTYPYIGLGFQLGELDGFTKVGHYGGDRGFRSYLFMIPEKEMGFVILANCDYNEDFRQEILHPIAKLLLSGS